MDKAYRKYLDSLTGEELRARLAELEAEMEELYRLEPEDEDEDHEEWEDALDDLRDEQDELLARLK
jgi:hypothetical protein